VTTALDDFGLSAVDRRRASRLIAPAIEAGWSVSEVRVERRVVRVLLYGASAGDVVLTVSMDRDIEGIVEVSASARWSRVSRDYDDLSTAVAALGGAQ
jgi:hypothetical protein